MGNRCFIWSVLTYGAFPFLLYDVNNIHIKGNVKHIETQNEDEIDLLKKFENRKVQN